MARRTLRTLRLGGLLFARAALAQELPESVLLRIDDCSPSRLGDSDAYAAAKLELEQSGVLRVRDGTANARAELTVRLRCDNGVRATLQLHGPNDRSSAPRIISLDDVASKDRARVLALALAELVRSDWPALAEPQNPAKGAEESQKPAATTPTPASSDAVVDTPGVTEATRPAATAVRQVGSSTVAQQARPIPAPPLRAQGRAFTRWYTAYPAPTLGLTGALRRGRWSIGAEAVLGRHSIARGTASYGLGAATLGVDILQAESGRARWALAPMAALGATWVTGSAQQSSVTVDSQVRLYADVGLMALAGLRLGTVELSASVDGGRATGIATTDRGSVIAATGGWFVGAGLGLGF